MKNNLKLPGDIVTCFSFMRYAVSRKGEDLMDRAEDIRNEEYEELVEEITSKSTYAKKAAPEKKWMTVTEMGNLLGLKKTDRYWLVHKNLFETREIVGQMRVNIASFEKWYANQIKYHKVTGEEPGKELKEWSFSIRDLSQLLAVEESVVYDLIKRENLKTVIVDYWKRVPKEEFWRWYKTQSRYQTREDREAQKELYEATISMPEMARLLGLARKDIYSLLKSKRYGSFFDVVVIAEQKRITKESFQKFLNSQDKYHLDPANDYRELSMEENAALADYRRKKLLETGSRRSNGNFNYLSPEEAALLAKVSRTMIVYWYRRGEFPIIRIGNRVRIRRKEFESWLEERGKKNGVHSGTK